MNVKHGTESRDWIMVFHCPELLVSHSVATLQLGTSLNLRALLAPSEERKAERGPPGGCARGAASPWRCSPSPCAWPAARAGTGPGWGSRTPHICGPLKQSRERFRSGRARGRAPSTELLGAGPLPRHLPPRAASSLLMRWLRSAVSEAAGTEKGTSSTAYLRAHGAVSGPARGRPATAPPRPGRASPGVLGAEPRCELRHAAVGTAAPSSPRAVTEPLPRPGSARAPRGGLHGGAGGSPGEVGRAGRGAGAGEERGVPGGGRRSVGPGAAGLPPCPLAVRRRRWAGPRVGRGRGTASAGRGRPRDPGPPRPAGGRRGAPPRAPLVRASRRAAAASVWGGRRRSRR